MKYKLTTTLSLLKKHEACESGYRTLRKSLGTKWPDDKPINLLTILASNGVQDMCWCFRATVEDSTVPRVLCAADFAKSVLHYFTAKYPKDNRPANAIKAARDFAEGEIDKTATAAVAAVAAYGVATAAVAAYAAYGVATASAADAAAVAYAAYAAAYAAYAADVAFAADAVALAAAFAADAVAYAAAFADDAVADAAARKKEREKQANIIRKWLKP